MYPPICKSLISNAPPPGEGLNPNAQPLGRALQENDSRIFSRRFRFADSHSGSNVKLRTSTTGQVKTRKRNGGTAETEWRERNGGIKRGTRGVQETYLSFNKLFSSAFL